MACCGSSKPKKETSIEREKNVPYRDRRDSNAFLREQVQGMQEAIKVDPAIALMSWSTKSVLEHGMEVKSTFPGYQYLLFIVIERLSALSFFMMNDQPMALGGADASPCPVQSLLASLSSCQAQVAKAYGVLMGIDVKSVEAEITGSFDLKAFMMVGDAAPPTSLEELKVSVTYTVAEKPSKEVQDQLKQLIAARCPVCCMLNYCVEIDLKWKTDSERILPSI